MVTTNSPLATTATTVSTNRDTQPTSSTQIKPAGQTKMVDVIIIGAGLSGGKMTSGEIAHEATSSSSSFKRQLETSNKFCNSDLFESVTGSGSGRLQQHVEQEESKRSVHHRKSFSSSSSSSSLRTSIREANERSLNGETISKSSSSIASQAAAALSTTKTLQRATGNQVGSSTTRTADLSRHFKTSSLIVSSSSTTSSNNNSTTTTIQEDEEPATLLMTTGSEGERPGGLGQHRSFLDNDSLFSSPGVRSIVKEIGTDFAELENALTFSSSSTINSQASNFQNSNRNISSLSSRLFGSKRLLSPIESRPSISNSSSGFNLFDEPLRQSLLASDNKLTANSSPSSAESERFAGHSSGVLAKYPQNGEKIKELLTKAEKFGSMSSLESQSDSSARNPNSNSTRLTLTLEPQKTANNSPIDTVRKSVMSVSIERIDQRMGDLCTKLNNCNEIKEAIDLLKVMIQMIEKAWSVPVCGDDLGFKLCNSLREAGGLDIVLGFIQDADEQTTYDNYNDLFAEHKLQAEQDNKTLIEDHQNQNQRQQPKLRSGIQARNTGSRGRPLRLNLSKVGQQSQGLSGLTTSAASSPLAAPGNREKSIKDSDSELLTSDLDSASIESLPYTSANQTANNSTDKEEKFTFKNVEGKPKSKEAEEAPADNKHDEGGSKIADTQEDRDEELGKEISLYDHQAALEKTVEGPVSEDEASLRKEELVFLSAKLLSQCLTSENRNYIVANGLKPVIKLACNFTTMKSTQSQRLFTRSILMARQASLAKPASVAAATSTTDTTDTATADKMVAPQQQQQLQLGAGNQVGISSGIPSAESEHSDVHAIIGTEILQHLFKHSEDTCSKMISLSGLQAILYGCRSSNVETLRHCASALANLALYGGHDCQQIMIEQKAHVWLFPLAFNEDDNVQYYACLAIVVLVANQEIEADVLESSTLDLVEPFVTQHEPQKFAESTTAHIHGQSASWLRKLIPLLESKREEARNLACFHFAMEAYIKREQNQSQVFRDIGAVEALYKVGSSPLAIASKFACQALRLIGEREPHKLSQQVPLWTSEDVMGWIDHIGFEKFKQAFVDSRVDGDLLLQLDDEMLKNDIGIENGIIRRRFLRELSNLKKIADYSSIDRTGLTSLFSNLNLNSTSAAVAAATGISTNNSISTGSNHLTSQNNEFIQYIYPMLQLGVTRDTLHLLDCEQLLRDCKISNSIHQIKFSNLIKELQEKQALVAQLNANQSYQDGLLNEKTLDVFVSYRRSTGSQLASLLKVHLQLRGFSVFIDVERLEAGKFDNNLLDSIKAARNFILVLSPNALDRCIGDHDCKDWVHKEIVAALASDCNIIPIIDNFHWPDSDQLPEDMRSITYFNGVRWIHDYQDACVDKVERFIRGELNNNTLGINTISSITSGYPTSSNNTTGNTNGGSNSNGGGSSSTLNQGGSLQRNYQNVSTPAIAATPLSSRMIPFDSDYHPLSSYSSNHKHHYQQQQQQHHHLHSQRQQSSPSPSLSNSIRK